MFSENNPWKLRKTLKMPVTCPECGQRYELEVGFWYGTGYVSYGLCFILSLLSFFLWVLVIGVSTTDNRFFWWMGINAFLLVLFQPWIMRLSRVLYLYIFVSYDPDYKRSAIVSFDYRTEEYYTEEKKPGDPAPPR
jgi:hypothetical protein